MQHGRVELVHADYRTGNFLYDKTGITGILDWEMAHAGDPVEDVAWLMIKSWRWAGDDRVGGLCSRDDFIRMYEDAGGVKVDRDALKFWEVLGNVKFATLDLSGQTWVADANGYYQITDAPMTGVNAAMRRIGWDLFYGNPVALDPLSARFLG